MPWTGKEFASRHNHSLSPGEASKASAQANAILASGAPEGVAIATANKHVNKLRHWRKKGMVSAKAHSRMKPGWSKDPDDIPAATT
jgi:uncharacterized protein YdaT